MLRISRIILICSLSVFLQFCSNARVTKTPEDTASHVYFVGHATGTTSQEEGKRIAMGDIYRQIAMRLGGTVEYSGENIEAGKDALYNEVIILRGMGILQEVRIEKVRSEKRTTYNTRNGMYDVYDMEVTASLPRLILKEALKARSNIALVTYKDQLIYEAKRGLHSEMQANHSLTLYSEANPSALPNSLTLPLGYRWKPALMSLLLPGLGQKYNQQHRKARIDFGMAALFMSGTLGAILRAETNAAAYSNRDELPPHVEDDLDQVYQANMFLVGWLILGLESAADAYLSAHHRYDASVVLYYF